MKGPDFIKLASYLVTNYMLTSKFNQDLEEVQSFQTEQTIVVH